MNKRIVIYGAGKIGRGFVADIFASDGYRPLFVDDGEALINALKAQGKYTLYHDNSGEGHQKKVITGYEAMLSTDAALPAAIQEIGLVAVTVFPDAFASVSATISSVIQKKYADQDRTPLDLIILANTISPQKQLRENIYATLSDECKAFADEFVGVAGTVVNCYAVQPSEEIRTTDPLAVQTDGENALLVESSFKGNRPECPRLEYHDSLEVLQKRKLYMYNMAHVAAAYLGSAKSYTTIQEALDDPEIEQILRGALREIGQAFVRECGFSEDEMKPYCDSILVRFQNPLLNDTLSRVGSNPIRKLSYSDRVIGAALMARRNGIYPYYLLKIAAYGFMFAVPDDAASMEIRKFIMENGIDKAIRKYTGLNESDLIYSLKRHYMKADGKFVVEDAKRVEFIKRAYEAGFWSEKKYRGCAQGTLNALKELTGIENKDLFRAATGFSGGMALCGDGVCGGYSGGLLFMSYIKGRDFDRISIDGDKKNQYLAYECAQILHDHYIACYGSTVCMHVHEGMFNGEHFILRTKPRRNEFEDAGAHTVVCTTVVALACSWIAEILLDKGLYSI